jgi:hypothetical protein
VPAKDILGRITNIIEAEPRPSVPMMLDQLERAYRNPIQLEQPADEKAERLLSIVEDLYWYAFPTVFNTLLIVAKPV